MKKILAFTLIEVLVVTSIIGLLAAAGSVSYTAFTKNARDARRKADLEEVRGAIELYRSNNGTYPLPPAQLQVDCSSSGGLTDGSGNTYMSKIPKDPKCNTYSYYYTATSSNYTLGAFLENSGPNSCGSCGTGVTCNYCVGPYGQL